MGRNVYACQFNLPSSTPSSSSGVQYHDECRLWFDMSEIILTQARSSEEHDAGQIIRNFVSHFSRS